MWIPPEQHKVVGAILADTRKKSGVTQVEMAQRLGKPQSFVSSYEQGQRRVDILEFLRICDAMSANPEELFQRIFTQT